MSDQLKIIWILLSGLILFVIGLKIVKDRSISIGFMAGQFGGGRPIVEAPISGFPALVTGMIFIASGVLAIFTLLFMILHIQYEIDAVVNISKFLLLFGLFSGLTLQFTINLFRGVRDLFKRW